MPSRLQTAWCKVQGRSVGDEPGEEDGPQITNVRNLDFILDAITLHMIRAAMPVLNLHEFSLNVPDSISIQDNISALSAVIMLLNFWSIANHWYLLFLLSWLFVLEGHVPLLIYPLTGTGPVLLVPHQPILAKSRSHSISTIFLPKYYISHPVNSCHLISHKAVNQPSILKFLLIWKVSLE